MTEYFKSMLQLCEKKNNQTAGTGFLVFTITTHKQYSLKNTNMYKHVAHMVALFLLNIV